MSVNKVIILGRIGQDPELKYTPGGVAVVNLSVATSEHWTDKSGKKQEKTEWHRVQAWGKLAEIVNQYMGKGSEVYLEGKLSTRSWEKDGVKRFTTEIVADTIRMTGGNKKKDGAAKADDHGPDQQAPSDSHESAESNDASFASDDIPF